MPQTPGEPVPAEPQEGKPVAQAFRLQNRSTAEFAMLLRNFAKAVMETNNKEFANSLNVYYDNNTQTVVVLHHENWIKDELPAIVSFYDAQPGTINYAYANLSDFLTKNPGAKAKSFSVKNIPAETLCHFLRCLISGSAVPEDSMKIAFFADEKSKKLIVAHNMDEDEDDIFPDITKFIELCDQEIAMPPHEGMIPPPQVQFGNQSLPATDESPAQAFDFGDAFLENDAHGFGFSPNPDEAASPKAPAQEADALVFKAYYVADLVTNSDGEVDFDVLSDLIRETISPDDWTDDESETGNTIKAFHNARTLIIKAPEETHTQIADLLAQLREMSVPQSLR